MGDDNAQALCTSLAAHAPGLTALDLSRNELIAVPPAVSDIVSLQSLDLSGKKVASFGLGDQGSYGDNFCDAAGELYDCFSAQGATMVGLTATDDYDYSDSQALRDGKFCGLLCDEDNEYDKSEGRANDWVEQLKGEGVAF